LKTGEQRRLSLGKVGDLSLAEARQAVLDVRSRVSRDEDPAADLIAERNDAREMRDKGTVEAVANSYFAACQIGTHRRSSTARPKRKSSIDLQRRYFDKHILPAFGRLQLANLTQAGMQDFVNGLALQHSPSAARHTRNVLQSLFQYAVFTGLTEKNVASNVVAQGHSTRTRVLSDDELRLIWATLSSDEKIGIGVSRGVAYALKLALVTLQRRSEIAGMRLDELDLPNRQWLIPGQRTKNHRSHLVPLSDLALDLINRALMERLVDSPFVFPSPRNPGKPIEAPTLSRAFGRLREATGLQDARPHDLRRTGATTMTRPLPDPQDPTNDGLRKPISNRFFVSMVLNHASDHGGAARVTGVYDQYDYFEEKRTALNGWASHLVRLFELSEPSTNVVILPKAKG
jgi:integrase